MKVVYTDFAIDQQLVLFISNDKLSTVRMRFYFVFN